MRSLYDLIEYEMLQDWDNSFKMGCVGHFSGDLSSISLNVKMINSVQLHFGP